MSHAVILTYRTTLGKQGTESTGVSAVVQRCTSGKSSYKEFQQEYRLMRKLCGLIYIEHLISAHC